MDRHATSGTRTAPNTGADHQTVGAPPRPRPASACLALDRGVPHPEPTPARLPHKAAVALVRDAAAGTLGVARIARQLPDRTNN